MSASYPTTIVVFTPHTNLTEVIDASHVNRLQDEVTAVETAIGPAPQTSTTPSSGGTFNASSATFANLVARLANIETGVVSDAHTQYVHKKGGDTIAPAPGTVGLLIQPTSAPTGNLWEVRDPNGTLQIFIDQNYALNIGGGAQVLNTGSGANTVQPLVYGGSGAEGSLSTFAREDHIHALPALPAPPIAFSFHIAGSYTTGLKLPKFIAPVNMTLSAVKFVNDAGSGATFNLAINRGSSHTTTSASVGASVLSQSLTTSLNAGDTVQVNIVSTGGSDLSVTVLAHPS